MMKAHLAFFGRENQKILKLKVIQHFVKVSFRNDLSRVER